MTHYSAVILMMAAALLGGCASQEPADTRDVADPAMSPAATSDQAVPATAGPLTGVITEVSSEYGNLETSIPEDAVAGRGIVSGTTFTFVCRDQSFEVTMAESYEDVSRGAWVAFINWEGKLRLARSFANAAETSGCAADDDIIITF